MRHTSADKASGKKSGKRHRSRLKCQHEPLSGGRRRMLPAIGLAFSDRLIIDMSSARTSNRELKLAARSQQKHLSHSDEAKPSQLVN